MATTIEYALMAGASYISTRTDVNKFPIPQEWAAVTNPPHFKDDATGFEAISFTNGTEIVISYAGTYEKDLSGDIAADISLATGFGSDQLEQAAEYYLQVKALNPTANITLTGHSLGGGLASLIGVFFGVKAHTFDQAPFANSAEDNLLTPDVADNLKDHLLAQGYSEAALSQLTNFLFIRDAFGGIPNASLVTNINVQGEFLSGVPWNIPDRIGTTVLDIANGATGVSGTELHSIALLTVFLAGNQGAVGSTGSSPPLNEISKKLPNLLQLIFDEDLYANDTDTGEANLLETLLRHQFGVGTTLPADGMLDGFARDLSQLTPGGLIKDAAGIENALITALLQGYDALKDAQFRQDLFTTQPGGFSFDIGPTGTADGNLAPSFGAIRTATDITTALQSYYVLDPTLALDGFERYTLQAGQTGLIATDSEGKADLMAGGSRIDKLDGGAGNDLILGGAGGDLLEGGAGDDQLMGGVGRDIYLLADGSDTIRDADADGRILYNSADGSPRLLAGGQETAAGSNVFRGTQGETYSLSGTTLSIALPGVGTTRIEDFAPGRFGINLLDFADPAISSGLGWAGDGYQPADFTNSIYHIGSPENSGVITGGSGSDFLFETAYDTDTSFANGVSINARIDAGTGNDWIVASYGVDDITAGAGDDAIFSSWGRPRIDAGEGNDLIALGVWVDPYVEGDLNGDNVFNAADLRIGWTQRLAGQTWSLLPDGSSGISFNFALPQDMNLKDAPWPWPDFSPFAWQPLFDEGFDPVAFGGGGDDLMLAHDHFAVDIDGDGINDEPFIAASWTRSTVYFDGGAGNDRLLGRDGFDQLVGGVGNDYLAGQEGDDFLSGGPAQLGAGETDNDVLWGDAGSDQLFGGAGNDTLYGDSQSPVAGAGDDYLDGGQGNDDLIGDEGDDLLDGGADDDRLWGDDGDDTLLGGDGADQIVGGNGADFIDGGLGDDQIWTDAGDVVVRGANAGFDNIYAETGVGSVVADGLSVDAASIYQFGGALLIATSASDGIAIHGGLLDVGQQYQFGGETLTQQDLLQRSNALTVLGTDDADIVLGSGKDDTLIGSGGGDSINGGTGDDTLEGGLGGDVYAFNVGDGVDTITDYDPTAGNVDAIALGADITPDTLRIERVNDDLILAIKNTPDRVSILNWFVTTGAYRVEELRFTNGETLDLTSQSEFAGIVTDASGNQTLTGTSDADDLLAGDGSDILRGAGGADLLTGGSGNDRLEGGSGSDSYTFGRGDGQDFIGESGGVASDIDVLLLGAGITSSDVSVTRTTNNLVVGVVGTNDQITIENWFSDTLAKVELFRFNDGTEWDVATIESRITALPGTNQTITGTSGNDVLEGGAGNDFLSGGLGDDTYLFGRGSGRDTIFDDNGSPSANGDTVRLGQDITPTDVTYARENNQLILRVAGTEDKLTILNSLDGGWWFWTPNSEGTSNPYGVERIEFADGTVVDTSVFQSLINEYFGTPDDDVITGTILEDHIRGSDGNDVLGGSRGSFPGSGTFLPYETGDDVIEGGDGDDTLIGGGGYNIMLGGAGNDVFARTVNVNVGDRIGNLIVGGTGNDVILNSSVADIFEYSRGDGQDKIVGSTGFGDRIRFTGGIVETEVFQSESRVFLSDVSSDTTAFGGSVQLRLFIGYDRYLEVGTPADSIQISQTVVFDPVNQVVTEGYEVFDSAVAPVGTVEFSDGTEVNISLPISWPTVTAQGGSVGDDLLVGDATTGSLIAGFQGNDDLRGGTGRDWLVGGLGDDTYHLSWGSGNDIVFLGANDSSGIITGVDRGVDRIVADAGIDAGNIIVEARDNDLIIGIQGTSDTLTVRDWYLSAIASVDGIDHTRDGTLGAAGSAITVIEFADGSTMDLVPFANLSNVISGTDRSDTLESFARTNLYRGRKGDDEILGESGNDTYEFNLGDGVDRITDSGGTDAIVFGPGITSTMLTIDVTALTGDGGNVSTVVSIGGSGDTIILPWLAGDAAIESFQFSDGTTDSPLAILARQGGFVITGNSENNDLNGTDGSDIFDGLEGADVLSGLAGDDTYRFGVGYGSDQIEESTGSDTISFGNGIGPDDIRLVSVPLGYTTQFEVRVGANAQDKLYWFGDDSSIIERFAFADGSSLTTADVLARQGGLITELPDTDTTVTASSENNTVQGGAGNDTISILGKNNTAYGGAGNDIIIIEGAYNNLVVGGFGDDVLIVNVEAVPAAGGGSTTLIGGSGNDTYIYNPRPDLIGGLENVVTRISDRSEPGSNNSLGFGVPLSEISLGYGSLLIRVGENGGEIHLDNFNPDDVLGPHAIDEFEFSDGTVLSYEQLVSRGFDVAGTDGNDAIRGTNVVDRLNGLAGDDVITSGAGDDVLSGDAGADVLDGGAGNDTYRFEAGHGHDMIVDASGVDNAVFGPGIAVSGLSASRTGDDLILKTGATDDITFQGWYVGQSVEQFQFADGTVLSSAEVEVLSAQNQPPQLVNPLLDIATNEDAAFALAIPAATFTDDSQGPLALTVALADGAALPAWLSFTPETQSLAGTPTNDAVGTYQIRVTATDSGNLSISDVFDLAVNNVNDAPTVMNPIADQTTNEDTPFVIQIPADTFTDVDSGDSLTYGASLADGAPLPDWLAFNPLDRTFGGAPDNTVVGTLNLAVTATDAAGASASSAFVLTVNNVNDAPTLAQAISDLVTSEDAPFSYQVPGDAFADVDAGDTLTYSATQPDGNALPVWLSFDPVTRIFSGTPANGDVGAVPVRVNATDTSGATTWNDFVLTVNNVNDAPTVAAPIPDLSTDEDALFSFQVPTGTFSDVDVGDSVSYSVTLAGGGALPAWLSFDVSAAILSGTPENADVGIYDIEVSATDSVSAGASDRFLLTVNNTNDAPVVAQPIPDQEVQTDGSFAYMIDSGFITDADVGDLLAFSVTRADGSLLPGWLSFDPATRTLSGTPGKPDAGTVDVRVIATDTGGVSVSDDFRLIVSPTPVVGTNGTDFLYGTIWNDVMYGLDGADFLSGDSGNDFLSGGANTDTLYGGAGTDTLQGDAGIDLIFGGIGDDVLDGGAGSDVMFGNDGNDAYSVESVGDFALEFTNQGTDSVTSAITYTLGSNVENLTLTGATAINGTGNTLNNIITGNSANNVLKGNAGNDTLAGDAGTDTLNGGTGNDIYIFNPGNGQDAITDSDTTSGNNDTVRFGVNPLDLVFTPSGNNLVTTLHGGTDSLTVNSWYTGAQNHVETLTAADGRELLDTQVDQLIQAMAQFSASNGGITWDQAITQRPQDVESVISAYWHAA